MNITYSSYGSYDSFEPHDSKSIKSITSTSTISQYPDSEDLGMNFSYHQDQQEITNNVNPNNNNFPLTISLQTNYIPINFTVENIEEYNIVQKLYIDYFEQLQIIIDYQDFINVRDEIFDSYQDDLEFLTNSGIYEYLPRPTPGQTFEEFQDVLKTPDRIYQDLLKSGLDHVVTKISEDSPIDDTKVIYSDRLQNFISIANLYFNKPTITSKSCIICLESGENNTKFFNQQTLNTSLCLQKHISDVCLHCFSKLLDYTDPANFLLKCPLCREETSIKIENL